MCPDPQKWPSHWLAGTENLFQRRKYLSISPASLMKMGYWAFKRQMLLIHDWESINENWRAYSLMEGGRNMEEVKRQSDRCKGIQKLVQRLDTTKSSLRNRAVKNLFTNPWNNQFFYWLIHYLRESSVQDTLAYNSV